MDTAITDTGASTSPDDGPSAQIRWIDGVRPAAIGWLAARVLMTVAHLIGKVAVSGADPTRGQYRLLDGLIMWDGSFYRDIATTWYNTGRPDWSRFFPLYPGMGRVLGPVMGDRPDVALVLVNNLAAFVAAVLVWRLTVEVTGDRGAASRVAWLISLVPPAFVLTLAYTEGLAIGFAAAALLMVHRRRFVAAGVIALFAALLRPVGGLILVAILVEIWTARRSIRWWQAAAAVLGPLIGFAVGLWWISLGTGDFALPFTMQQEIRGSFMDPITRTVRPLIWFSRGDFHDVSNFLFMWTQIALLWLMVRLRQPLSWILYTAATMIVLFSSQVVDSVGRYGLVAFPLVIALAQWAETRTRLVVVTTVSCCGFVALASLAWLNVVVP